MGGVEFAEVVDLGDAEATRQDHPETSARELASTFLLTARQPEDASIGVDWRSSMMADSARDPYRQVAVRRETS